MPKVLSSAMALLFAGNLLVAATIRDSRPKMGSPFEITVIHRDPHRAREIMEAGFNEIDRLEAMISSWRPDSETSAVNRKAGIEPVPVSRDLFNLIRRSIKVSELTKGAFDLTFAAAGGLWDFESGRKPDPKELEHALQLVDYRQVRLDPEPMTIYLPKPGMRLGFGAIGKGFAANRAIGMMKGLGAKAALVNAGGDLVATGVREDGRPWEISIADPRRPGHVIARLQITEQAIVTSGDYERFAMIDGQRYAHIIDPRHGNPVSHLASVTIICPDGELADALATAVFVMGPEEGMALVNRLRYIDAILITPQGEILFSRHIESKLLKDEASP